MTRKIIALIAVMLLLSSSVSLTVVAKPSGNGSGNSANAKACQKGGWQNLARSETPWLTFNNQGDCVSYGAQGGVIHPFVPGSDACLDFGNLAATASPTLAFTSVYECIGHMANGGTVVPYDPVGPVDPRSISVVWRYGFSGNGEDFLCNGTIFLAGFPEGSYTLARTSPAMSRAYPVSIGSDGSAVVELTPPDDFITNWAILEGTATTFSMDGYSVVLTPNCR